MRKIYVYMAAMLCGLAMATGCTKENVGGLSDCALEIFAEGSGTKTTVSGTSVKWVEGDEVWINGASGTVTQSGEHWYAAGTFITSSDFNSFYPATIATDTGASNLTTTTATVVFPPRYASSFDGSGNQVLTLPMAARSAADSKGVLFKHLSAGINVVVTNSTGSELKVDSVSVTSASVNLCGPASVGLSTGAVPTVSATGDGTKTVTVCFSTPVAIAADGSKTVQVPVIPNSTGLGDLTVKVYSHITLPSSSIQYLTYSKTKGSAPALGRNEVASLAASITTSGSDITSSILGAFSVSSTKKVYFSQGNLQATWNGTSWSWAFAANQWDYIGNATGNTSISGNGTISGTGTVDLFGWVGNSSSWTGAAQYGISNSTATNNTDGYGNVATEALKSDWGNTISDGYSWRTLSGGDGDDSEWKYLFKTRTTGGTVFGTSQARYAHATITDVGTGVNGIILFPDGVDIASSEVTTAGTVNGISNYATKCTTAQWMALAAKGCVFLPAAGRRNGTTVSNHGSKGYYCSSSPNTSSAYQAYGVYFYSGYLNLAKEYYRYYGYSVRLVREVE